MGNGTNEQNRKQGSSTFWWDVLVGVRLFAMYTVLYFGLLLLLPAVFPFFHETLQIASFLANILAGSVVFVCLPKDMRRVRFFERESGTIKTKQSESGVGSDEAGAKDLAGKRLLTALGIIMLSFGGTIVLNILMGLIPWGLFIKEEMQYSSDYAFSIPLWLSIIGVGFVVPFSEEVCFRGVLYQSFAKHMKVPVAMALSALIFGIYHFNIQQGIYAFFMGLLLAAVVEKTGALSASILFHAVSNLTVTLYSNIPEVLKVLDTLPGLIVSIVLLAAGVILVFVLPAISPGAKNRNKNSGEESGEGET